MDMSPLRERGGHCGVLGFEVDLTDGLADVHRGDCSIYHCCGAEEWPQLRGATAGS
jgi:hypothetical protein